MANTVYISAGLSPKRSTGSPASNTGYISAGLMPDTEVVGEETLLPNVFSSISIADHPEVVLSDLAAVVNDTITGTEYVSVNAIAGISISVNDQITVTDYVSVEVSSLVAFTYDGITVLDVVSLSSDSFIAVTDSVTVNEYSIATITAVSDLNVSTLDVISILEYVSAQNILGNIYTYETVSVDDVTVVTCELSGVSVYDSITVNEDTTIGISTPTGYQIIISDSVNTVEYTELFYPEYGISVSDTITVTDVVEFLIAFIIGTLQIYTEVECMLISSETECLELFAEVV